MVAHCTSPRSLRPIVSGADDVVQDIAKEIRAQIMGCDNGRKDHPWADMILLIDTTRDLCLAAHRAVLIWGVERAGFVTVRIIRQRKGSVSNDFGLLRPRITDGKAITDAVGASHTEGHVVVADGLFLIV